MERSASGRVPVVVSPTRLRPDPTRVLARAFVPGEWALVRGESRLEAVARRVLAMPEVAAEAALERVREDFGGRHRDLDGVFRRHYEAVAGALDPPVPGESRRLLVGAFFTQEYALEGAALCNPSAVLAPGASEDGTAPLIVALRAIGEGHISSIEFRTAEVRADGSVRVQPPTGFVATGMRETPAYERKMFRLKLIETGADEAIVDLVLAQLGERFTKDELDRAVATAARDGVSEAASYETFRLVDWLASSNYVVVFPEDSAMDERVLFPAGPVESQGMEDARFVRFVDDDGAVTYYATYTAYDGFNILPQLIETPDFRTFRVATLNGASAQNKGIALFPRRIGGRFAALARHDRESISYMTSDNVRFWTESQHVYGPTEPWELIQIGNCGPPIETPAGWLVLTHGVGAMRRYTLGALLLDLDDPTRVIGRLAEPLLAPDADDRDGYVPNVVYTCGGVVHAGWLVLPYGFADQGVAMATLRLDDLLDALLASPAA